MKLIDVSRFLRHLGCTSTKVNGNWVSVSCPLAIWKHASGRDEHPSFGVNIGAQKTFWHCFTCNTGGTLEDLLAEIVSLSHSKPPPTMDVAAAYKMLDSSGAGYVKQKDWEPTSCWLRSPIAWPEDFLSAFMPAEESPMAMRYLTSRRIYSRMVKTFDIRFDPSRKTVCVPIRGRQGELLGLRGRAVLPDGPKYHDYSCYGINNSGVMWFNEQNARTNRPVIITEGAFDAIAVALHYPNVMSPLSVAASIEKMKTLERFAVVYCFYDNDEAGERGYQKLRFVLNKKVALRRIQWPDNMKHFKDAAELPVAVVADMLVRHGLINGKEEERGRNP